MRESVFTTLVSRFPTHQQQLAQVLIYDVFATLDVEMRNSADRAQQLVSNGVVVSCLKRGSQMFTIASQLIHFTDFVSERMN